MTQSNDVDTVYAGRFLSMVKRGRWEYATRTKATGVVAVVAMHADGRVVLVEQHREEVDGSVIELPAGLAGDTDDGESLLTAAKRELEEETGYVASRWTQSHTACSSPGLTDERITLFIARGLSRTGTGGGVEGEAITVHEIAMSDLPTWLSRMQQAGKRLDMKLLAGLWLADVETRSQSGPS